MRSPVTPTVLAILLLLAPPATHAECEPDERSPLPPEQPRPQPGDTVTCSGGDADGFERGSIDALRVVVQAGADVAHVFLTNAAGQRVDVRAGGRIESGTSTLPAVNLFDTSGSTLSNAGEIAASSRFTPGVYASGTGLTIDNTGLIRTTLAESPAIQIPGGVPQGGVSRASLRNGGRIETFGSESLGIEAIGSQITVENAGTIATSGIESPAIELEGAQLDVVNTGRIETAGSESDGVFLFADDTSVRNGGAVETTGLLSPGIAIDGARADVVNTGSVRTGGGLSPGIAGVGGGATFVNAGAIDTTGDDASALQAGLALLGVVLTSDDNALENRGAIRVAGEDAHGMLAVGARNSLTNAAGASIAVDGAAAGLRLEGRSGVAANAGAIEASGAGAAGISMSGELMSATNAGRIEITGGGGASGIRIDGDDGLATNQDTGRVVTTADASAGIAMVHGGRIQNFGAVETSGDDAPGLVVPEGEARITNDGSVSTLGARAYGIDVGATAPASAGRVNHTGHVTTSGAEADGLHVAADGVDVVIGAMGGISTAGSAADGVELRGRGNAFDNAGEIQVEGPGAAGVRLLTAGASQSFVNTGRVASAGDAIVGSDGVELVSNAGAITGAIRLGGESDLLRLREGGTFAGVADGGSGTADELETAIDSIDTLDGGRFVGFETFRNTGDGLVAVTNVLSVELALVEDGVVAVTSGSTLRASLGVTVGSDGTLLGTGTVDGDILLDPGGVLGPGLSIGTLSVTGDAILRGVLEIDVGGPDAGAHDALAVLGGADLRGATVLLSFVDGFVPSLGDAFSFLTAASVAGLGELTLDARGLPAGFAFALQAGPAGLVATTTAVPEPSTLLLVGVGGACGLAARRARLGRCDARQALAVPSQRRAAVGSRLAGTSQAAPSSMR